MRTLILGAGAIGCLAGGKLAQAGVPVTLVGRPRLVEAVTQRGLRLEQAPGQGGVVQTIQGVDAVPSVRAALEQAGPDESPVNLVVFTVKSYDTEAAAEELAAALEQAGLDTPHVLSLQNGVGNEEVLAAHFGPEQVIAGTITAPVEMPQPGLIRLAKPSFVIGLARWSPTPDAPTDSLIRALAHSLEQAGVAVTIYPDARAMKWTKLLMNMIGNASSAIWGEPPQVTFADPHIADLEVSALREALAVMAAQGLHPVNLGKYPLGWLAPLLRYAPRPILRGALRRIVSGARGDKMPSLYLDLEKGKRQSEVDWLNGAVVRAGEAVGVATPVNRMLNEKVLWLAQHPDARPPGARDGCPPPA